MIFHSRGPHVFKQRELTRAIRAALTAGIEIERVEIAPDGRIVIIPKGAATEGEKPEANEWDKVLQ